MDIGTLLLLILWLAVGVFAARWIVKFPTSQAQKMALSGIGILSMIGLGSTLFWIYSLTSETFGGKVFTYRMTHSIRQNQTLKEGPSNVENIVVSFSTYNYQGKRTIFPGNKPEKIVTVFRPGEVNYGTLNGDMLSVDPKTATKTSFWWMLWDTKYYNLTETSQ